VQKTISQLVTAVCNEFNLPSPSIVVSSQDPNVQKLLAFALAVNDDLLAEYDWQALQTRYTFSTVPAQAAYPFPADIARWINGTFFDTTNRWELRGPKTPRQWEWLLTWNSATGPFESFRVWNNQIEMYPVPTSALNIVCDYISNYAVLDGSTGLPKAEYTQDSDICRFDARVVINGIKLKWLTSIGADTTSALAEYKRHLEFAKGQDAPSDRISLVPYGRFPFISNANLPEGKWA
jgi:hypothetical protein